MRNRIGWPSRPGINCELDMVLRGRDRHLVIFAGFLSLLVIALGVVLAFVVAPKQEREWRRIERFPPLDRNGYTATPGGEYVVVTGRLQDNATLNRHEMVAYWIDEWIVSRDKDGDEEGRWRTVEVNVPGLTISIDGGVVKTAPVNSVASSGQLHEFIERGRGRWRAPYAGRSLPDGSLRTQGLRNRDLVTVVGRKISTGELYPERLHAGDRAHLVDHIRSNARALRILGIVLLVVSLIPWLAIAVWTAKSRH
jgi:hypothetical protein